MSNPDLLRTKKVPKPYDARTAKACLGAAKKRVQVLGDKKLNHNLEFFCGSYADAYRCGVEEAQGEIVSRLAALVIGGKK